MNTRTINTLKTLPLCQELSTSWPLASCYSDEWRSQRPSPPPLSSPHEQSPQADRARCEGVVKDAKGEPVVGASVRVKGTTTGATTDAQGRFSFAGAKAGASIEISCVGYATITVRYAGTPLSVTLQEDSKVLDDVVVVGYGVQRKVNLTGAVSSVKGKELAQRPVADATQSLQGLVPGLLVSNTASGRPVVSVRSPYVGRGTSAVVLPPMSSSMESRCRYPILTPMTLRISLSSRMLLPALSMEHVPPMGSSSSRQRRGSQGRCASTIKGR